MVQQVKGEAPIDIATNLSLSCDYSMSDQKKNSKPAEGIFACKTCNKEFASFQALGGHRTSHNRHKSRAQGADMKTKPRAHECMICGMEFTMGQALGGHMRRHRPTTDSSSSETVKSDHFELLDCNHPHPSNSLQLLQLFPDQ
ncbi:zinc finger protein ZAT11-like protein [Carex littledalei]|uniref:Zinc finger protein ZAT11-like protein n=1 Tax=Carex littledalei TaxID=544730 RepID=A0A833QFZ7_9POAL|nr:zinc finger protein ZAT11-like protein [Carex littledalei]